MLFLKENVFFKIGISKPGGLDTISDRVQTIAAKYLIAGSNLDLELEDEQREKALSDVKRARDADDKDKVKEVK